MAVCKFQQRSSQVKDKEGNISQTRKEVVQYFNELLNQSPVPKVPSIPEASAELNMNCERPSKVEIVHLIKKLMTGKGAGPDNIPPKALKSDPIYQRIFITACLERYGKNRCLKILKAGKGAYNQRP